MAAVRRAGIIQCRTDTHPAPAPPHNAPFGASVLVVGMSILRRQGSVREQEERAESQQTMQALYPLWRSESIDMVGADLRTGQAARFASCIPFYDAILLSATQQI